MLKQEQIQYLIELNNEMVKRYNNSFYNQYNEKEEKLLYCELLEIEKYNNLNKAHFYLNELVEIKEIIDKLMKLNAEIKNISLYKASAYSIANSKKEEYINNLKKIKDSVHQLEIKNNFLIDRYIDLNKWQDLLSLYEYAKTSLCDLNEDYIKENIKKFQIILKNKNDLEELQKEILLLLKEEYKQVDIYQETIIYIRLNNNNFYSWYNEQINFYKE